MNIREMHTEIQQASQNIAANTRRKLLDAEVDWLLNKNQLRFIQSKVSPRKDGSGGFQINELGADAIRTLLQSVDMAAERTAANEYVSPLPGDYSYLVSDDSRVKNLCGANAPALSTVQETVLVIPLPKSTKSAPPYYADVALTIGDSTLSLPTIVSSGQGTYTGTQSKNELYLVRDTLLWHIRHTMGIEAYWEQYREIAVPNAILLPWMSTGQIILDGTTTTGITKTRTYSVYTTGDKFTSNRLTPSDKVSTMLDTPYYKPSYLSPVSELNGQGLKVYGDASFIVSQVRLFYVRKPRRMSLTLGSDCELPEAFHQAVCDLTVEYFKAMTADPNWQVKLQDNMLRSAPIQ